MLTAQIDALIVSCFSPGAWQPSPAFLLLCLAHRAFLAENL
jgi:hypothetical protein